MKKNFGLISILVLLLGVIVFVAAPAYSNLRHPEDIIDGGSNGTVTWIREDKKCDDSNREKTTCTIGGEQQCTAQYCN